jgi:hypothetical protein
MSEIGLARPATSPAAERMRRYRERRRDGMRCYMAELRETEIDALIRRGLLKRENRDDAEAVLAGLYAFLEQTLDGDQGKIGQSAKTAPP